MRQGKATELKIKIDRAEKMSEPELAQLRTDIKVGTMAGKSPVLKVTCTL